MPTTTAASSHNLIGRLQSYRDRYGATEVLCKALDVVFQKVFRLSVHEVVWLDVQSLTPLPPPDTKFTFRFLTADELVTFAQDSSYFIDPALADGVRAGREVCFAALAGNRLAAFGCFTLQSVKPEQAAGAAMSFPSDVAYMSYGYTHPDFRGSRLHGLVMSMGLQELAKFGVTKLVSIVGWTNCASLKSCWRLGYTDLGKMFTFGSKKRALGLYPRRAKQLGVRFGRWAQLAA